MAGIVHDNHISDAENYDYWQGILAENAYPHPEYLGPKVNLARKAYSAKVRNIPPAQYFDYYYTGQDCFCYIRGAKDYELSIAQLAFSINQQKQPIFGFWSYVYDAVAYGNRIIQGQMVLNYRSQGYLLDAIATSVKNGPQGNILPPLTTEDQENVLKYWGTTLDYSTRKRLSKHLFVHHPPFDLVVVMGMQNASMKQNPHKIEQWNQFQRDTDWLAKDLNERLIDPGNQGDKTSRFTIVGMQLTAMAMQPDAGGSPITEAYTFFARDVDTPLIAEIPKR